MLPAGARNAIDSDLVDSDLMHSDLMRPLSQAELDHLRRAQSNAIRASGMIAAYAFALLALLALYFGYLVVSSGGGVWGLALLGAGAAFGALTLRIALAKNTAAELYSDQRPLLLFPPDATKEWREAGFGLIGGVASLLAFLFLVRILTHDCLRWRAFVAAVKAAYAQQRHYQLA